MLYDFQTHMEELRANPGKKDTVENYEKYYGKIKGDIYEQIWYIDYVRKFVEKAPVYMIPEDLEEDFDWKLLFGLVAASFSSTYRIVYQEKKCLRSKDEGAHLSIFVSSKAKGETEKDIETLWSLQILRLYEIYVEEQMNLQSLIAEDEAEASDLINERKERFEQFSKTRFLDYNGELVAPVAKSEDMIYHYTSFDSFFKIITGSNIRFSDTMRLNDPTDVRYSLGIFDSICELYRSASDYSQYEELLYELYHRVESFWERPCFLLSFSNLCDSLDQWFKYGDFCRGVSIGLLKGRRERDDDMELVRDKDGKVVWIKGSAIKFFDDCIEKKEEDDINKGIIVEKDKDLGPYWGDQEYDENTVRMDVMDNIQQLLEDYSGYKKSNPDKPLSDFVAEEDFTDRCESILYRLLDAKNNSFESEKEFRFQLWPKEEYAKAIQEKYTSRGQYGHFISIPFDKMPIKEVWVGPMAPKGTEEYVKKLLEECGYSDFTVKRSIIPLNI